MRIVQAPEGPEVGCLRCGAREKLPSGSTAETIGAWVASHDERHAEEEELRSRLDAALADLDRAEAALQAETGRLNRTTFAGIVTVAELRLPDGSWPAHRVWTARAELLAARACLR